MRAGRYVQQHSGYRAFIPAPLPPAPGVRLDGELTALLSEADRALGRLDGVSSILPNPDLFVAMYVRYEAVLSSQIEGTQSTLEDVLEFEMDAAGARRVKDAEEVVNYVQAMNYGLERLPSLPLSLRLLREIHERLMRGVRGSERNPGDFRTSQNWIGPEGCTLASATFVPPPPYEMLEALANLETFLHQPGNLPALIHCGLAHAQFETIHPFLDGNGRVGRLLITLLLCERRILERPLLYLSVYLKQHRAEYYDRLTAIRSDGDWEGWLRFFLRGVAEVSVSSTATARAILKLREDSRQLLAQSAQAVRLLDFLFAKPVTSVRATEEYLGCSYVTASSVIEQLVDVGLLREMTGQKRNRLYRYEPYLALFEGQGIETARAESRSG
ncbi:Fic family protein [Myxococcus stipitatus]|uniref:Fic family protein n=1 Tax=Myxococcus stipitatus TaxID=83455 RepID=UPI002277D393|nr:Fic family protein [Myxococcus stipitatus]